jgi:hypothetical protein
MSAKSASKDEGQKIATNNNNNNNRTALPEINEIGSNYNVSQEDMADGQTSGRKPNQSLKNHKTTSIASNQVQKSGNSSKEMDNANSTEKLTIESVRVELSSRVGSSSNSTAIGSKNQQEQGGGIY